VCGPLAAVSLRLALVIAACLVIVAPVMVGHYTWRLTPAQDRYQILQLFVVIPYIAYLIAPLLGSEVRRRGLRIGGLVALGAMFVAASARQVGVYADVDRLYAETGRNAAGNTFVTFCYAASLRRLERYEEASQVVLRNARAIRRTLGDSAVRGLLIDNLIASRNFQGALDNMADAAAVGHIEYVAAISLEAPDTALRNDARGVEIVGKLRDVKLSDPDRELWWEVQLKVLQASARAASGHFDEAMQLIEQALADPALQGPGKVRALGRVDLESRLRSYPAGVRYPHPESQVFWTTYSIGE
jgi:hypothetical protein